MQHVQAFLSVHGAGGYIKHLKIIEYVGFDTGKAGFCCRKIIRFNGKRNVLALFQSVVAFFKLIFSISAYSLRIELKSVVLRRDFDSRLCLFLSCALIDEKRLHRNGSVKVVEKIAPVFKNGGLIVCLCKLIVNIFKEQGFYCISFPLPCKSRPGTSASREWSAVRCGASRRPLLPVSRRRFLSFFCAGQLTLHGIFTARVMVFVLPLTIADTSFSSFRCFSMTA